MPRSSGGRRKASMSRRQRCQIKKVLTTTFYAYRGRSHQHGSLPCEGERKTDQKARGNKGTHESQRAPSATTQPQRLVCARAHVWLIQEPHGPTPFKYSSRTTPFKRFKYHSSDSKFHSIKPFNGTLGQLAQARPHSCYALKTMELVEALSRER